MRIPPPPVRVLVAVIVLLPVVAVSAALTVLLVSTNHSISESLGGDVVETETARVADEITSYLSEAVRVSDLYARRLNMGTLPLNGLTAWEGPMADDLFTSRHVASICFGNRQGEATYLQLAHGRRELGRVPGPLVDQASEYEVDLQGRIYGSPLRVYQYDARQRPWYTLALRSSGPRWTPPYFWFGTNGGETETGCGYTRVINDATGRYAGVLTVDVTLGALSDFLHALPFANTGHIYVIDDGGYLVASSHGAVNSIEGQRLRFGQSSEPSAQAVAAMLAKQDQAAPAEAMRVTIDGKPSRARVTGASPFPGIDWRIVTVMPESAFLAEARTAQRRAILMAVIAAAGALALSLILGRRISLPLRRLTDHVARIGAGEFDSRLELRTARELSQLATATNEMAGGLKERMELENSLELATQVQQSLLPRGVDPPAGLDVAGVSRYCDQTGGDYFDFIDIAGLPHDRMLIAVGDVMGHGIAAALLMATARAALRTGALNNESLGTILTNVNHVLAKDARHGRFMTMVLLTVDPAAHAVHWASAGHDPLIAYDPQRGELIELAEGDLLLGAMDGESYGDYTFTGLHRGTILFIGTDGIWEAENPDDEMYGKDRLHAFIKAHAHKSATEMVRDLERELTTFRAGRPARDDVTYVVVKMVGTPAAREMK